MLWEIGGSNAFQPLLARRLLDLPVVDADAMGRAFPRGDMTSFAICDLPVYPWTLADIRDNGDLHRGRGLVVDGAHEPQGLHACSAPSPRPARRRAPAREVKEHGHPPYRDQGAPHRRTGARRAPPAPARPVARCCRRRAACCCSSGKVHDVMRRTTEGFLRGTGCASRASTQDREQSFRGSTSRTSSPSAGATDESWRRCRTSSASWTAVSGEAIGTETIRYGQRVSVVALPAAAAADHPTRAAAMSGPAPSATTSTSARSSHRSAQ